MKRPRLTLPPIRSKHRVLEECVELGLRGFLWNDLPERITEETIGRAVELALNRIMLEINERFR